MNNAIFQKFQRFIKKYHKKYNSINEFLSRFEVFKRNVINSYHENASYSIGITQFFDLTQQEFTKKYLNLNSAFTLANFNPYHMKVSNAAPDSFDWRDKGAVSPVYMVIGSGTAIFVTIDHLESLYYLKKKQIYIFLPTTTN